MSKISSIVVKCERESGNAVLLSLIALTLLVGLASAQFAVVQKNTQSSRYFSSYSDLQLYAESGVDLALHDLKYSLSGNGGKIGTVNWTLADDVGGDGVAFTYDLGEGDGLPTIGEPNVNPVAVGPTSFGASLIVYVTDTAFPNVQRVVATAASADVSSTVDTYAQKAIITLPKVGSVYVDPTVALDLKGNAFLIDGRDYKADGTPAPLPPVYGIATEVGSPPSSNQANLIAQVPAKNYDQIKGTGVNPSVGEVSSINISNLFATLKSMKSQDIAPGTYSSPFLGDWASGNMQVTHVDGDLHLTGNGSGAGVLLIEGSLRVSGQFTFYGIVISKGDVTLVGGGSSIHTLGAVLVGQTLSALDPDGSGMSVTGNANLSYSSSVIDTVQGFLESRYSIVYYDDR